MDFANKAYIRLVVLNDEAPRAEAYRRDVKYLENFLMGQRVDFETVFTDSHEAEVSPFVTLKVPEDAPTDYIPDWLKNRKIRKTAIEKIRTIAETNSTRFVEEMTSRVLPRHRI